MLKRGVILMLRGGADAERPQAFEAEQDELNRQILPPDVKIHPYYDRSELVALTTDTVGANLLRGMALVLIVLIFFLVSVRAAAIVAVTIPLCFVCFIVLQRTGIRLLLIVYQRDDFGIVMDDVSSPGQYLPRVRAAEGRQYNLNR